MSINPELEVSNKKNLAVSVNKVSKKFCRNLKKAYIYGLRDIGAEIIGRTRLSSQLRAAEFWALRNVSFELEQGQSIGIVGLNGSGKSTLVRIIGGLYKPDTGSVNIRGRVATLNVLGAGFNPLLTGRENIYNNMSILGLSKKEIDRCFDEVINFSEIPDAIDSPVRTYSSGMRARLGFACAVFTVPKILLLDEVLAVGDRKFRTKCYRKLAEIRESGTSFIMVSHNPVVISRTCDSAIYLKKGRIVEQGDVDTVMQKYEEDWSGNTKQASVRTVKTASRASETGIAIQSVFFRNNASEPIPTVFSGEPVVLCVKCGISIESEIAFDVLIRNVKQEDVVLEMSSARDGNWFNISPGETELLLYLPYCGIRPGIYLAKINVFRHPFYVYDNFHFEFQVKSRKAMNQGLFYQVRKWDINRLS
ncbi:MAG: polysaccharide ABC transporter ATP-binding protein [Prochloraceae cyanobacterium]